MQAEHMRAGRWELVRPLGWGGMGEVWLARDPNSGEEVALKRLLPGALDAEHMLRFQREVEALRSLRHPGVVGWIESGADARGPWFAAELCLGGSLQDLAASGTLPLDRAVGLARDLALALSAAHGAGLLHRDVKPSNALLDRAGRVRLADFGLARPIERGRSLTESGTVMGSPGYLAPEQVQGDKERIGPATDVYGLGATLHYLLTGKAPFGGRSVVASLAAVLGRPATPPSALRREVPPELDRIVLRCLAKSPDERYPDMQALLEALEGLPSAAVKEVSSPLRALVVVALLVVVGGGLLGWSIGRIEASGPPATTSPTTSRVAAGYDDAQVWFERGIVHFRGERWREAARDLDRALELDPRHEGALIHRGLARASLDDAAGALSDLARAVLLDPRSGQARWNRGRVLFRFERLPEALEEYDHALALIPGDLLILEERAAVLGGLGRWADAISDLDLVIGAGPPRARPHFMRALACQALDRLQEAIAGFDRALELGLGEPDATVAREQRGALAQLLEEEEKKARFERGRAHFEAERWREALLELDRILELDSRHARAWRYRGLAHARAGDLEAALRDLGRAVELDPASARARWDRGKVLWSFDRREEALAEYDAAVALAPEDLALLEERATARCMLGRHADAIPDLDRLLADRPPGADLLLMRAISHQALGHLREALADCEEALRLGLDGHGEKTARALRVEIGKRLAKSGGQ